MKPKDAKVTTKMLSIYQVQFDYPFRLTKVSDKTVLGILWKYTERFNKTTALGFNQWLEKQIIDFLLEEPQRKVLKLPGSEMKLIPYTI